MGIDFSVIVWILLIAGGVWWWARRARDRPRARAVLGAVGIAAAVGALVAVALCAWITKESGIRPGLHGHGGLFVALVLLGCAVVGLFVGVLVFLALLPGRLERSGPAGEPVASAAAGERPPIDIAPSSRRSLSSNGTIIVILAVGGLAGLAYLGRAYQVSPGLHSDASLIRKATDPSHPRCGAAISELGRRGASVVPALLEAACDPSTPDPGPIPGIVARIGGEEATAALVALLGNERPKVRFQAAVLLGAKQHPAAVDVLFSLLEGAPEVGVGRAPIVRVIAGYGRAELFPRLLRIADAARVPDTPSELELALVSSACQLGHPGAVELLESRAGSKIPRLRGAVARQTVCFRSRRSAEVALKLLSDPEASVRVAANSALVGLSGLDYPVATKEMARVDREGAERMWLKWWDEHPEVLAR